MPSGCGLTAALVVAPRHCPGMISIYICTRGASSVCEHTVAEQNLKAKKNYGHLMTFFSREVHESPWISSSCDRKEVYVIIERCGKNGLTHPKKYAKSYQYLCPRTDCNPPATLYLGCRVIPARLLYCCCRHRTPAMILVDTLWAPSAVR